MKRNHRSLKKTYKGQKRFSSLSNRLKVGLKAVKKIIRSEKRIVILKNDLFFVFIKIYKLSFLRTITAKELALNQKKIVLLITAFWQ